MSKTKAQSSKGFTFQLVYNGLVNCGIRKGWNKEICYMELLAWLVHIYLDECSGNWKKYFLVRSLREIC